MNQEYFKIQFNKSNKKFKISEISTFQALKDKIKKSFKKLNTDFDIYWYNQEGERYELQDQDDFRIYLQEKERSKLYVKRQTDEFESYQNSLNNTNILNITQIQTQQPINNSMLTKGEKNQIHNNTFQNNKSKQQQILPSKTVKTENIKPDIKQKIQKQTKQDKKMKEIQSISAIHSHNQQQIKVVHKINCNQCNISSIIGNRWRCLECIDIDFCDDCHQNKKTHMDHKFLMMDKDDYLKKINYKSSIYLLFNPNFKNQNSSHQQITPWISQEDIIKPQVQIISQLRKATDNLSSEMLKLFAQWDLK